MKRNKILVFIILVMSICFVGCSKETSSNKNIETAPNNQQKQTEEKPKEEVKEEPVVTDETDEVVKDDGVVEVATCIISTTHNNMNVSNTTSKDIKSITVKYMWKNENGEKIGETFQTYEVDIPAEKMLKVECDINPLEGVTITGNESLLPVITEWK